MSLMALTSFIPSRDDAGDRLGITLTLILASIAFKYTLQDAIPKVSYQTIMDVYIVSNFALAFCWPSPSAT